MRLELYMEFVPQKRDWCAACLQGHRLCIRLAVRPSGERRRRGFSISTLLPLRSKNTTATRPAFHMLWSVNACSPGGYPTFPGVDPQHLPIWTKCAFRRPWHLYPFCQVSMAESHSRETRIARACRGVAYFEERWALYPPPCHAVYCGLANAYLAAPRAA